MAGDVPRPGRLRPPRPPGGRPPGPRPAEEGLGEVNAIGAAIRRGEGSLGKLVRDDEAYRRLLGVSDRGERALTDLDENLAAMKQTWPLSRYFSRRGFDDRDRVLF